MRRLAALPLLALALAGCTAADAAEPQTADEMVAQQLSEVQDWQSDWDDSGCAENQSWDQICGVQLLAASFVSSTASLAFDRTLYPALIDDLTDDERNAMLPAINAADEALQETRAWQHIDCQESPTVCLESGAATAEHLGELATELDALALP